MDPLRGDMRYRVTNGRGEWSVMEFDENENAIIHCKGNGFHKNGMKRTADEVKTLLDHDEGALHALVEEAIGECRTCGHRSPWFLKNVEPRNLEEHDAVERMLKCLK